MPQAQPELKKVRLIRWPQLYADDPNMPLLAQYLDKRLFVQLNGSRKVLGVLRGYDVCLILIPHYTHKLSCMRTIQS